GNRIVKVAPSGAASLVTITGTTLSSPQGVAVDGNGNLYIADAGHRRVIQLTTAGVASVVATPGQTIGTLLFGITPDSNGNLLIADWLNNRVIKVDVSGATLNFATTPVGATSSDSPRSATVTNVGNEALAFSTNPSYTAEFPENTSEANPCTASTSLDPGEVCDISVLFTPQSPGGRSANIVVTNNHLNGSEVTQTVAVSGTGAKATPTITLTSDANPAHLSESVTLTASVSSSLATPTGSVNFYDGATLLGSGALASGAATYATSSLVAGTHSITAQYAGDANFLTATSSAVSLVITDLNFDVAAGGSSTATVSAGGTATYHLTIAPSSGSALPAVTLSATGGPTGSTITITPQTIAAGAPATAVTVSINVGAARAIAHSLKPWALAWGFSLAGIFVLPFGIERKRPSTKRAVLASPLLLLVLMSIGVMSGCGSRSAPPSQSKNYTVTVNATSGSLSHTTTLTLIVQ
ncbi:MAG TPA: Ig-like domain repeat protein, partial [Terriglobia bacterium]|nr:Ig-like domain repeat protein [Terriglobia bacterium]